MDSRPPGGQVDAGILQPLNLDVVVGFLDEAGLIPAEFRVAVGEGSPFFVERRGVGRQATEVIPVGGAIEILANRPGMGGELIRAIGNTAVIAPACRDGGGSRAFVTLRDFAQVIFGIVGHGRVL